MLHFIKQADGSSVARPNSDVTITITHNHTAMHGYHVAITTTYGDSADYFRWNYFGATEVAHAWWVREKENFT